MDKKHPHRVCEMHNILNVNLIVVFNFLNNREISDRYKWLLDPSELIRIISPLLILNEIGFL